MSNQKYNSPTRAKNKALLPTALAPFGFLRSSMITVFLAPVTSRDQRRPRVAFPFNNNHRTAPDHSGAAFGCCCWIVVPIIIVAAGNYKYGRRRPVDGIQNRSLGKDDGECSLFDCRNWVLHVLCWYAQYLCTFASQLLNFVGIGITFFAILIENLLMPKD